mgnify:FL=1
MMNTSAFNQFCRNCGTRLEHRTPDDGDTKTRAVCPQEVCKTIHYVNPLNVVGTVPVWQDKVLLCRRAIEPRHGKWTLPAGFMELNETLAQGATRETTEEAGAQFEIGPLFTIVNVLKVGQVHFFYMAQLTSPVFDPGPESLEAQLFSEDEIPWSELAFHTVKHTLEQFFADRKNNAPATIHTIDLL